MAHSLRSHRVHALALLVALTALPSLARAQALPPPEEGARARLNGSPRHGEWISFEAGAGTAALDKVSAWVVYPERPDPAPVVLVVHEIFGLSDWVRSVADQLAAEGFIAVAPDLLSGKGPDGAGSSSVDADGARALIGKLDQAEVTRRLDAAAAYALSLNAASKSLGIVGFCWGGGISFNYATTRADLKAAVSFYGTPPQSEALARIRSPVLALYGGSDARVTSTQAPTAAEMKRLGKRFESEIYPGAGHAFMRQQGGMAGANLNAATLGWPRAVDFLKRALLPPATGALPELPASAISAVSASASTSAYDDCCGPDPI